MKMGRGWAACVACVCALSLGSGAAWAGGPQGKGFGLGLILGEPSGLSLKNWFTVDQAVQAHLSFDFSDEAFALLVDYLYHFDIARLGTSGVELPVYVGIGGKVLVDADDKDDHHADNDDGSVGLGVRIPLGLAILPTKLPLEFFLEVGLGLRVIPATHADIDGGLGVRYYF